MVLRFSVMSSPVSPSPRVAPWTKIPFSNRRLIADPSIFGSTSHCETLGSASFFRSSFSTLAELSNRLLAVLREDVVERKHGDGMPDRLESRERTAADALGGRIRAGVLGIRLFQFAQLRRRRSYCASEIVGAASS